MQTPSFTRPGRKGRAELRFIQHYPYGHRYHVVVFHSDGLRCDWPIMHEDGRIAWDNPESFRGYYVDIARDALEYAKLLNAKDVDKA